MLQDQILQERCKPFIDDVAAKPPSQSMYPVVNGKPKMSVILGVRLYILKAIQSLNDVLTDIERVGGTILGFKSVFVCKGLKIVLFVCDSEGDTRLQRRCGRSSSGQPVKGLWRPGPF